MVPYLFAALMALEYGYNLARGGRYQSPRDSATSLMVAIPHFAMLSVLPVAWVVLYRLVEHAMPWHLPAAWWIWPSPGRRRSRCSSTLAATAASAPS